MCGSDNKAHQKVRAETVKPMDTTFLLDQYCNCVEAHLVYVEQRDAPNEGATKGGARILF